MHGCLCKAAAGRVSRGEEEDGCSSVRSEMADWGRSHHSPEICSLPVEQPIVKRTYCCDLRLIYAQHTYVGNRQCLVSYLFKQPVVSGSVYTDVPDHQHLDNT